MHIVVAERREAEPHAGSRRILVILVLAVAVLDFAAIGYGLPQRLNPDEQLFITGALRMLKPPYFDPGWFGHPASTLMDVLAGLYAILIGGGLVTGVFNSLTHAAELYRADASPYFLVGRAAAALAHIASVVVFHLVARRLLAPAGAVLATVAFSFAPGNMAFGQIIRAEMFMVLFIAATIYFSLNIIEFRRRRDYLLAGAMLGLAMMSKYPAMVAAVPIIAATALDWRQGGRSLKSVIGDLVAAAGSCVATAFIVAPYFFLDFGKVLRDVAIEGRAAHLSHTASGFFGNVLFYAGTASPEMAGPIVAAAGLLGLISLPRRTLLAAPVLTFGAVFWLFISALSLFWVRWALPLVIVLALGFGEVSGLVIERLRKHGRQGMAWAGAVALLLLLPGIAIGVKTTILRTLDADTRVEAEKWIRHRIPCRTVVLVDTYAPQLSVDCYDVRVSHGGRIRRLDEAFPGTRRPPGFFKPLGRELRDADLAAAVPADVQYVVTSEWHGRFSAEADRYPAEKKVYDEIAAQYRLVRQFIPGAWRLGPPVFVFVRDGNHTPRQSG